METPERSASKLLIFTSVIGLAIVATTYAEETSPIVSPPLKEYRIVRSVTEDAQRCIDCHAIESKGIVADWAMSRHAHVNVSCLDCHAAGPADPDGWPQSIGGTDRSGAGIPLPSGGGPRT